MLDLDAYCARIGYAGPREPTLATLCAIHALHPAAIPFENLDPLLGLPVSLELAAVEDKLVRRRRGGYCFEHNTLFRAALDAMGFATTGLAARVVWMAPPDRPPGPRTHMLLRLDLDGQPYIVDVGFGGLVLDAPLRLIPDVEQTTPTEMFRIVRSGDAMTLQARIAGIWQSGYTFSLDPQVHADYVIANWYTSTHPKSLFCNNLMLERLSPGLRLSLLNRKLTRRTKVGAEQRLLTDAADLARTLTDDFTIDPPADATQIFDRLPVG